MSNKVFVGNLAFKTREPDLSHEFETAVAKVVSVNIISRGPRSLGYGFVEFENEEAAKRAVEIMNHKEVDGRAINVEIARARDPNAPTQPRPPRAQFPRQPRQFAGFPPAGVAQQYMVPAPTAQRFFSPRRGPRMDYMGVPAPQQPGMMVAPQQQWGAVQQPRMQMMNPMGMPMMFPQRPRRPRGPPRQQQPQENRQPSKTTLFVANLPFIVEDENLKDIFSEFNVKEARVMKRPNNKSKGYGFVELNSEEDHRRALQTLDKIEVEGRTLIIKAALTEPFHTNKPAVGEPPKPEAQQPAPVTAVAKP